MDWPFTNPPLDSSIPRESDNIVDHPLEMLQQYSRRQNTEKNFLQSGSLDNFTFMHIDLHRRILATATSLDIPCIFRAGPFDSQPGDCSLKLNAAYSNAPPLITIIKGDTDSGYSLIIEIQ